MGLIEIKELHIHVDVNEFVSISDKLNTIIQNQTNMAKDFSNLESQITALNDKADKLQASLDAEQEQITAAIETLHGANAEQTALIQQLRDELAAAGADQAKIDELATLAESVGAKMESAITDLENTMDPPATTPEA